MYEPGYEENAFVHVLTYEVIIDFRGPHEDQRHCFFSFCNWCTKLSSSSTFFWSRRHTKSCSCSNKNSFVRLRDQKVVDEGLSFASIAQPKKQKWHFWMKRKRSSCRWNCKKNETTSKAYSQSIDLKPFVGGNTLTCLLVLVSQRLALSYSPNHLSIEWSDEKFAHEVPNAFIDVGNR